MAREDLVRGRDPDDAAADDAEVIGGHPAASRMLGSGMTAAVSMVRSLIDEQGKRWLPNEAFAGRLCFRQYTSG